MDAMNQARISPAIDRMLPNPHSPDAKSSVLQGLLVGRDDLVRYFSARLLEASGQRYRLRGARRIGKTAFMKHLAARLPAEVLPVYFGLDGRKVDSIQEVITHLCSAIACGLGSIFPATTVFSDLAQAHRAVKRLLKDAERQSPVVLFVDEFDLRGNDALNLVAAFYRYLAELLVEMPTLSIIMAVGRDPQAREGAEVWPHSVVWSSKTLGPLSETHARSYVLTALEGHLRISAPAVKRLFQTSGGHPYVLTLLLNELLNLFPRSVEKKISSTDISACVSRTLQSGHSGFEWMWNGLTAKEKMLAATVAVLGRMKGQTTVSELLECLQTPDLTMDASSLESSLESIREAGFVTIRGEARDRIDAGSDVLREWILHHHSSFSALPEGASLSHLASHLPNLERPFRADAMSKPVVIDTVEAFWKAAERRISTSSDQVPPEDRPFSDPALSSSVASLASVHVALTAALRKNDPSLIPSLTGEESLSEPSVSTERSLDPSAFGSPWRSSRQENDAATESASLSGPDGTRHLDLLVSQQRFIEAVDWYMHSNRTGSPDVAVVILLLERWNECLPDQHGAWLHALYSVKSLFPEEVRLLELQHHVGLDRVLRLLQQHRSVEAAAALGGLGVDMPEAVTVVEGVLLARLEEMTRAAAPDAAALLSIVRRLLPDPAKAWHHYLAPLLDESLRAPTTEQSEALLQTAVAAIKAAGAEAAHIPTELRNRIEANLKRLSDIRDISDEKRLAGFLSVGDLARAEEWLETLLSRQRSPFLEESFRHIRSQRRLATRYVNAMSLMGSSMNQEAQREFAAIVGESADFIGPDGQTALSRLEEITVRKCQVIVPPPSASVKWWWAGVAGLAGMMAGCLFSFQWVHGEPSSDVSQSFANAITIPNSGPTVETHKTYAPAENPPIQVATREQAVVHDGLPTELDLVLPRAPAPASSPQPSAPTPQEKAGANAQSYQLLRRSNQDKVAASPDSPAPSSSLAPEIQVASPRPPEPTSSIVASKTITSAPTSIYSTIPTDDLAFGVEAAKQGRSEDALAAVRRAIQRDPRRAEAYTALGSLYLEQGRTMEALRTFQKATALDKTQVNAWFEIGKLHQTMGHREEAAEAYDQAIRQAGTGSVGAEAKARLAQLSPH